MFILMGQMRHVTTAPHRPKSWSAVATSRATSGGCGEVLAQSEFASSCRPVLRTLEPRDPNTTSTSGSASTRRRFVLFCPVLHQLKAEQIDIAIGKRQGLIQGRRLKIPCL